jgi:phage baseplate assembly protein W
MQIDYPFRLDSAGGTATTDDTDHIRDLIEQVLFTAPGERVNRPDFGAGMRQLIFAPNSDELAAATESLVQGSLQRWLGELIQVENVTVQREESTLYVKVAYMIRRDQSHQTAEFKREEQGG